MQGRSFSIEQLVSLTLSDGLMRGSYIYPEDFIELLSNFHEPPSFIHAYLAGTFGILATTSDPASLWNAIVGQRGEEGAEDVVSELIIEKGEERVKEVIRAAAQDHDVLIRADDPAIVRQLFNPDGLPTDLGYEVLDYWQRSRGCDLGDDENEFLPETADSDFSDDEAEDAKGKEDTQVSITDLISGKPRRSAAAGAGWRLERVEPVLGTPFTVGEGWREKDLEDFLWENWERVDFGFGGPLYLLERQVQLNPKKRDRVDLLARGENGEWVAIELKIVEATGGDFTQLLSYLSDLSFRGIATKKIRGLLVAPSFAVKVLNAAAADSRVTLLRFRLPGEQ